MSILLPQDWQWRLPLPQRIDWSNPLTRGLGRLVTPSSGLLDVAANNIASAVNNVVRNPLGFSGTVGSASAIVLSDFATTRYTCLFVAVTYVGGVLEPRMVTRSDGAATYHQNYALNLNGGITPRAGHKQVSNNAYPYVQSSISVPAGGICVGVSTYDGSNIKVFTNGRLGGSVAASDPYTSLGASGATQFLNSDGTSRFADAAYRGPGFLLGAIWNRALTDDEVADISANPWQLFQPLRGIPIAFDTGGGTQTLTPSLYTNNQTFYSPTVTPRAVTLSPSLYTNQQTFYGPTVTAGAVTLQPPLVTNDQTFYGPTVVAGAVTLQPALYTNTQNFYSPTVTSTVTLQPDLYTNQQSFYSPTIAPGAVTLTPDLYTNTQAFYSPTVSQVVAQTIYPDLFVNQNQFFSADVLFAGGGGTVKGGWATERRKLELSIQQRQAQQTLAQSKDKVAKKIAKRIERFVEADFQDEIDEIVALQKEFAKLEARYNNSQQLSTDLRDATTVLQEFIQDEQDAIDLLMLVQEFDARCVIEATASPDVASLMGSA